MNKRVLITGISKGIGRALAIELINLGYTVIGTSRHPDLVTDKIPGATYLALDLSNEESITDCALLAGDVDILINNAGQSQIGSAEDTEIADYKEMFQVNFFGMVHLTSLLIPNMRSKKWGKVINVGSLIASFPIAYYTSYSSTKAATQAYSFALSMELQAFGIQVSLVEPNDVRTSIVPRLISSRNSPYLPFTSFLSERVRANMQKASDPKTVALKIAKVVQNNRALPYYTFGLQSKLLLFSKRFATQNFVNKNVYKQYGLADISLD